MRDHFGNDASDYDSPGDVKDILIDRRLMNQPNLPDLEDE